MVEKEEEKMEVDTETRAKNTETDKSVPEAEDVTAINYEKLKESCQLLEKAEPRYMTRVLQALYRTRKGLTGENLQKIIVAQLNSVPLQRDLLLKFITTQKHNSEWDMADAQQISLDSPNPASAKSPRPIRKGVASTGQTVVVCAEVEVYIHLLVVLFLIDKVSYDEAYECAQSLLRRIDQLDKRSLDPLAAKAYYFLALIAERQNRLHDIRLYLNSRLRVATLRRERASQAVLINSLLRSYLLSLQNDLAAAFISKISFPMESANINDCARFLYYQGRIKATQLDYNSANEYLLQAMRKTPRDSAVGFKQSVQKLKVVVSLLLGDIPDRPSFRNPIFRKPLAGYLELTQAVRLGDLAKFNGVLDKYGPDLFEKDGTLTLIARLKQNVIKTAVRQISAAYSRISVEDVRGKLQLQHTDHAEYHIAKALNDGSIEAELTYDTDGGRYMQSSEPADIYSTTGPQLQFHKRIQYCLDLNSQAVRALRYPPKSYATEIESIEEQREREQHEMDFAKEMADDEESEDFP